MFLLNPKHHTRRYPDARSREIITKTIAFFEAKGKANLRKDDLDAVALRRVDLVRVSGKTEAVEIFAPADDPAVVTAGEGSLAAPGPRGEDGAISLDKL